MAYIPTINHTPAASRIEEGNEVGRRILVRNVYEALGKLFRPSNRWHRLNEHLLKDIGKTVADAEFEDFTTSFGTSVRSAIENSAEGRRL